MKLTCVLIVIMLFLTVCPLITADHSRDKQEHPAMRLKDRIRYLRRGKLTRDCKHQNDSCAEEGEECCSDLRCMTSGAGAICVT
uniref:Conotoxin MiEr92 n=1 Tax=Conus miles TaxID=69564 RepID=O162_CONMI|nr:RecName: Full=Conotoxin MiEr92; Flags: Precursor [Conus miles]AAZ83769.1 MiEr92P [Conus miles]